MKKRKILLGLALAAAAVFSLSACDEKTDTTPETVDNGGQVTKYTIKFMNGTTEVESKQIDKDAVITAPTAPTKAEDVTATYTFKGWYTAETGGTKLTESTKATANTTYYAQFEATPKKYSITFMVGDNTYDTKSINYGSAVTAPTTDPVKDSTNENNYVFSGWYTAATGGDELTSTTTVTGAQTYYAHFNEVAREYNVIFMVGNNEYSKNALAYNADIVAPATNPTKAEDDDFIYTFDGWYTASTGGTKVTDFGKVTQSPTVFYAHFEAHQKYAVTFMNGANVVDEQYLIAGSAIVAPADPEKAEDAIATYTFEGWYTTSDFQPNTKVTDFGTVTEDITFYAHFNETVKQYDIKFYNGDTEITALNDTINANTAVTKPAESQLPTQAGKRFEFWTTNLTTKIPYNFATKITGDVNLYAYFVDADEYDTLSTDTNNLFASTFYNETIDTTSTSFDSETVALKGTSNATITTSNNVSLASVADTSFIIDLGDKKITNSAVTTIYATVVFDGVANGEAFMQIVGDSAKISGKEIFGLRTKKDERSGSSTNGSVVFTYRLDGGTEVFSNVKAETNATYNIKVILDTADGLAEIYINGTKITFGESADIKLNNSISKINGVKFTSKSGTAKTVDNVVINSVEKQKSELELKKDEALADVDAYKETDAYKNLADVVKTAVDAYIAKHITNILNATTVDAVTTLESTFTQFKSNDKFAVTVKAYSAAGVAETDATDQYIVSINGETDFTAQLAAIKFAGYTLNGIYTDSTLTTQATSTDVVKGATLCASVTKQAAQDSYSLSYDELSGTLNGKTVNGFTFTDTETKITIANNSIKFSGDGSKTKANIAVTLAAGTYTVVVNAKSGSTGNKAYLTVDSGTATALEFLNDGASNQTTTITLTETTTVYFYRTGGKTVNVYSINITKN